MPSSAADLIDELAGNSGEESRPWGWMLWLGAPGRDLTVKYLTVAADQRTSLQFHDRKDELLVILDGTGFVECCGVTYRGRGHRVRIPPRWPHRVTGPLAYLEVSTYDDGTDTIRLEDDYGRETG